MQCLLPPGWPRCAKLRVFCLILEMFISCSVHPILCEFRLVASASWESNTSNFSCFSAPSLAHQLAENMNFLHHGPMAYSVQQISLSDGIFSESTKNTSTL
ncbi:unnamed protein product [Rangifer tarandus platyrhynchus]|uniref:Uncharacterized protein n=2 Tax=Rangifer tarandus platyrhynchus TaxID=3082113 RepID=A0AC59YSU0_RANTA|nr:unnamed protein product [Rangifer tarandus platyrhynchus]